MYAFLQTPTAICHVVFGCEPPHSVFSAQRTDFPVLRHQPKELPCTATLPITV